MNDLGMFISNVGFPITVACAVGFVLYKVFIIMAKKIIEVFDVITQTNKQLVETNSMFAKRLEPLEAKITDIDNKLDKIIEIKRGDV
jgi:cell division protein FtsB